MTALYDYRATPLVNLVASEAMAFINQALREDPGRRLDMRCICIWSVDAVAPLADRSVKAGLAHEASIVISQALALDRMVAADQGRAA
jgi:hypothetical protein